MAFAITSAKFGFTEVKLGLIPAVISPFVLSRIGYSNASRYFLTGERFGAEEATRIGLVQGHYATEQLLDEAVQKVCDEIMQAGPAAVERCKNLLHMVYNQYHNVDQADTKVYVSSQIAQTRVSKEGQEGLAAFLSKRKPAWISGTSNT